MVDHSGALLVVLLGGWSPSFAQGAAGHPRTADPPPTRPTTPTTPAPSTTPEERRGRHLTRAPSNPAAGRRHGRRGGRSEELLRLERPGGRGRIAQRLRARLARSLRRSERPAQPPDPRWSGRGVWGRRSRRPDPGRSRRRGEHRTRRLPPERRSRSPAPATRPPSRDGCKPICSRWSIRAWTGRRLDACRRPAGRRARGRRQRHGQDDDGSASSPACSSRRTATSCWGRRHFRAAAADQLETWGARSGCRRRAHTQGWRRPGRGRLRRRQTGHRAEVDVVLPTRPAAAQQDQPRHGRTRQIKRVIEKQPSPIDEVLLVLDATTGQNGLRQAEVFAQVVGITGIVLTKLDGTAKGGSSSRSSAKLVPVKLVGSARGPHDLAPFDPAQFVDAIVG